MEITSMKNNPIGKIMRGECGQDHFRRDERCEKLLDKFCEHYKRLLKLLEKDKTLSQEYEKTIEAFDGFCAAQAEAYYEEGFVFGVSLGLEIADKRHPT